MLNVTQNRVPISMSDAQLVALDRWRATQPGLPSRAEAIRRAVDMLTGRESPAPEAPPCAPSP